MNNERDLFNASEALCTSSSDTRCDNKALHAAGMVGLGPSYQECDSYDVSGVAREIPPSEGGRNDTSLNVGTDIVGKKPKHSGHGPHNAREVLRLNTVGEVFELRNSPPDVAQDMSSRIERAKVTSNHGESIVPAFKRRRDCP